MSSYEAWILQNGDVSISNTDTLRILSDTYPRGIIINYFNFKYIFYQILIRYSTYTHTDTYKILHRDVSWKNMKCKKNEIVS